MVKKFTVPLILLSLVTAISYLSYYNYKTQKEMLLLQMHNSSLNVASSVSSAIERFHDIRSTINLQKLVSDVSFGLDIFEFRFIEPDGTIRNSIFKEEIGKIYSKDSFIQTLQGERKLKSFVFEERDYVKVMSIYYPIYDSNELVGIIDLSVDISEYNLKSGEQDTFSIFRRQDDIMNLLKSIEGSITNSFAILQSISLNEFLHAYVESAESIKEISIVDGSNNIFASSNKHLISKTMDDEDLSTSMIQMSGTMIYRTVIDSHMHDNKEMMRLMLLIDASTYVNHEKRLFTTATVTAAIALLFALFTSRLIYFSAIEQSRSEKERLEHLVQERTREIELLSKTDPLTGLWNRRYLEERLEAEFKRAKRYDHDLSIMIIDLDHFKSINDTYGHMAGDEVLRKVGAKIKECQRETDFIGRFGGEEIVVILPETDLLASKMIADSIRESIKKEAVVFESDKIAVTASIGVSSMRREHADCSMIFSEADEALYEAKKNGRDRVETFSA